MSFIEFESVYKRYTAGEIVIPAVDGVSFQIEEGEFCLIVGTSGAGKSTVLNMLGGMDSCDDGKIRVAGRLINNLSKDDLINYRRYDVGFVFQFYNLVPNLTALENVELPLTYANVPRKKRRELASEALSRVGLSDRMDFYPNQLSGGQKQRVAIARALVNNPVILLADEPTGALDSRSGAQVMDLFEELNREGVTVLVITHDSGIARRARNRVEIRDGELGHFTEPVS